MKAKQIYSIHKFGGSSLADAKKFMAIKSLLKGNDEVLVVSAVQGVTSSLQVMLDLARNGDAYLQALNALEEKHLMLISALSLNLKSDDLRRVIQNDVLKIKDILYAVHLTRSYSIEIQGLILGYGELWSAIILKNYLGQYNKVAFLDAAEVLFIYEKEGMICIDWERSFAALISALKDIYFEQLVIPGFIASTLDGQRTILGRNGSDFSAAIFGVLAGNLRNFRTVFNHSRTL